MARSDNPFGTFKHDKPRLEAVRLRERRLLWLGVGSLCAFTLVCLLTDQSVSVIASFVPIVQVLMR